jgi:3-hydroxyisobutyrate dehydrogenase-like beta-hydroxyacid dehydrogenase
MKVGFIGLGRMGQGIAGRVLQAGHELLVYNRTPEKAAGLVKAGARIAASVAAACEGREVVITMLADDRAIDQVAYADGGLLRSLPPDAIHLAMGTHGVDCIRTLGAAHAKAGQILVSAPVLGRPDLAATGQVAIVSGGPAGAVARCRSLFDVIGRRTFDAGTEPESAAAIKLANNFVLGCAIESMGEAFSLVRKYGVKASAMHEVLTEGLFGAPAYKVYGKIIAEEDYDRVGITARLGLKDANLALAAAGAAGVPLPSANVWRDRLLGAISHGDGDRDWAVMAREQARASGLD